MSDAKQATPAAELERQICSATEPKNEREWWAHHEIARLQESSRLRAELLAAARAELEALRADAERYRWLRERINWEDVADFKKAEWGNKRRLWTHVDYRPNPPEAEHIDDYIDEARKGAA